MASMDWLLRHRRTKGAATDRLIPNDAGACPLLYPEFYCPIATDWSKIAGWDSHPLRNAAFPRRTPKEDIINLATLVCAAVVQT